MALVSISLVGTLLVFAPRSPVASAATATFTAEADARVVEAKPAANFGTSTSLRVDAGADPDVESFLRFSVTGITTTVAEARLRVFATTGTRNGPAAYTTGASWSEAGITWSNRPARTSPATDDKGSIASGTWVEFTVTSLVPGDGTYSFVLAGSSTDGIDFNSREATNKPQLVVTTGDTTPPPTTPPPTTPPPNEPCATSSPSPAPGTFTPGADARVSEASPTTNFGATSLRVDAGADPDVESYLCFVVDGITAPVTSAVLRLFASTGTANGPAVYTSGASWSETGITWSNRPAKTSGATDDKGSIAAGTWVEYNVTAFVAGNGTYSFVLAGTSADGVDFHSREDANRPELVVTAGTSPSPTTTSPTTPPPTTPPPTTTEKIATAGDIACSTSDSGYNGGAGTATRCRQLYTSDLLVGKGYAAVLPLGDNQYDSGSLSSYRAVYDPTWGRVKSITRPVAGNHEYGTSGASGYFDYFGAAAGDRTKGYYSFDVGSWHLIALNSNCTKISGGCGAGSPQEQWLRDDLAAHPNACVLAYSHHARWSSGHDGSNTFMDALWRTLYDGGAEILLSGHSHNYEVFVPKNATGARDDARGVRQFVVGTGGSFFTGGLDTLETGSIASQNSTFGILELTLRPTGYDWRFVPEAGRLYSNSGSTSCH